jgi:tetratricopeptide (TPR) repeat protein
MEEKNILESWKEISSYLKHSVKTCQRWELSLGLPVHRLDGTPKARVFARKDELDSWLKEKQHLTEFKKERSFNLKRLRTKPLLAAAGAAVLLIVTGVVIWRALLIRATPVPEVRPSLAVLSFRNVPESPSLEDWTTALPYLMATDLIQSKFINVLPWDKTDGLLRQLNLVDARTYSTGDLKRLADLGRVDYAVSGEVTAVEAKTLISCVLQESQTGKVVGSWNQVCLREEEVFSSVDRLSREIRKAMKMSARQMAADIDRKVAKITTGVPEALHLYEKGYNKALYGRYSEAIAYFEKAVAIDPYFALAYQSLWASNSSMGHEEQARQNLRKAFEHSNRTSEVERLLIQGNFYEFVDRDLNKAIKSYEKMHVVRPQDATGYLHLARICEDQENWDKVIEINESLLSQTPHLPPAAYLGLVHAYSAKGLYAKAEAALDAIMKDLVGTSLPFNYSRALLHIIQRQFDPALALAIKTRSVYPDYPYTGLVVGHFHRYGGDFSEAESIYKTELERNVANIKNGAWIGLANLYLDQGRIAESIGQLKNAAEHARSLKNAEWERNIRVGLSLRLRLSGDLQQALAESREAYRLAKEAASETTGQYLSQALNLLELGRMEEFNRQTETIKNLLQKSGNPKALRQYYLLLGHREAKLKNISKAAEYFQKAIEMLHDQIGSEGRDGQAEYYDALAQAYYDQGNLPAAAELYEKISLLTTGRAGRGDIYARSFYRLGRIYEKQGIEAKAIENYRKFIDLWGNADPMFAEVDDARKRLEHLRDSGEI